MRAVSERKERFERSMEALTDFFAPMRRRRLPAIDAQASPAALTVVAGVQESAAERAYRRLEEAIVTMELQPGAVVSEAYLSELSGLGRGPVRDAVRRLAVEHLLVVRPKKGIRITEIDAFAQLRLLEVRQELERLAFCSAARRTTAEQRARFAALGADFRKAAEAGDELLFIRTDKIFNDLSRRCARNEFTEGSLLLIQGLSRRFWFRYFRQFDMLRTSACHHADVAEAIASGDARATAEAIDRLSAGACDFAQRVGEHESGRTLAHEKTRKQAHE